MHGRAGLDLRVSPFDFRVARELHGIDDLPTALRTYAVIGGVAAYAREMVDGDLPDGRSDFDRWVCRRALTPAAPLFHEAGLLLSDDPAISRARKINLYHAALAGVAAGNHAWTKLTNYVKIPGASLAPIMDALVAADLVERIHDPVRDNRPTYHPTDSLLRFHYAVIRPHYTRLGRHEAEASEVWKQLRPTFDSRILGPCFESMARFWTTNFTDPPTVGGYPERVGPTTVSSADGREYELDIVVAGGDVEAPSERTVLSIGEAKVGERMSASHLRRVEAARVALGERAAGAKLLLFAPGFTRDLVAVAEKRADVELIDFERLYGRA